MPEPRSAIFTDPNGTEYRIEPATVLMNTRRVLLLAQGESIVDPTQSLLWFMYTGLAASVNGEPPAFDDFINWPKQYGDEWYAAASVANPDYFKDNSETSKPAMTKKKSRRTHSTKSSPVSPVQK